MKTLYLVDVSSMFFRAFYAIPPMSTSKGLPTNALYGFLAMSLKLLREINPDYMAYCFDRKEPSFRAELYAEYKANRSEMPDDLQPQIPYVRKLTGLLGVPQFDLLGYEADDIIGSLAEYGRNKGMKVVIVSGDKDFAQLIGPSVTMYDTMREIKYDPDKVVEKWGVNPEQFIDYLAIVGDSSDNIPGIRGVGPKGATKLLGEYGTLDGIYKNLDKISSKSLNQKIKDAKEMAHLSRTLVTIKKDLDLINSTDELKLQPLQKDNLLQTLAELEFKSFAAKLVGNGSAPAMAKSESAEKPTVVVGKKKKKSAQPSFSTSESEQRLTLSEVGKLIAAYDEIWAMKSDRGLIFAHKDGVFQCSDDEIKLGQLLEKKMLKWKGYDLKSVWHDLKMKNPSAPEWDQMMAAYVVAPGTIESFPQVYESTVGKQLPDLATPTQLMNCQMELAQILEEKLESQGGNSVYHDIELPLVPVLYRMEAKGVLLDTGALEKESKGLQKDISRLEKEICEMAGQTFNIASPKQLAQILFGKLKLPTGAKTKTGYSTGSDVLEKLKDEYPICAKIIEFREVSKLKSTYVDALPALVNGDSKRLHTNLRQATTQTGRLSSINPNLQNIPIRTERGREIRKAFIAPKGSSLISADYSQIELRILAHITDDPGLLRAFADDIDIHAATASEIFGIKLKDVDDEMRRRAKAVNFGIAYGQGVFGLSESLRVSRTEAKDIIDKYFRKFPGVATYMSDIVEKAKSQGFVETMFGRRRYIPELRSKNQNIRNFGERAAINAPLQGTASDIVKKAMIQVDAEIPHPMLLQVHDELLVEVPSGEVEEVAGELKQIMENVVKLEVPLKVNVASGSNWEEAH